MEAVDLSERRPPLWVSLGIVNSDKKVWLGYKVCRHMLRLRSWAIEMKQFTSRGGVRLDFFNATWPFATLAVNREKIEINVPVARIVGESRYLFPAVSVLSVERYSSIPFVGWGIRIHHTINRYPSKVVFWTFRSPTDVLTSIEETGFPVAAKLVRK